MLENETKQEEIKENQTKEDKKPEEEIKTKEEISIDNPNIKELYEIVKITNPYTCDDATYIGKEEVEVSALSKKCRFALASTIYREKKEQETGKTLVPEEAVKSSYEKIFGEGTYEREESIPYQPRNELKYNAEGYYFTEQETSEEETSMTKYEKIIKAEKEGTNLYITSVPIYYERVNKVLCKDPSCENVIEKTKEETNYTESYLTLYIDYHKEELHNYTYHFQQDEAGFYRYLGYERTRS